MGPRGGGPGRGGRGSIGARVGAPPANLLSIGVVDVPGAGAAQAPIPAPLIESAAPEVVDAVVMEEEPEAPSRPAAKRAPRARPAAGRAAKKTPARAAAVAPAAPEAKPRRARAKKTTRTSDK
jgi:hypothetical protein